ncbi:MAG: hypothetical protein FJX76_21665 [Armatimonadetes bacterium]|nr:hypothetical protein [Armatimonadota bacterium]
MELPPDVSALDPRTRDTFLDLFERPLSDERTFALHVAQYRELVHHASATNDFIDVPLADRLAEVCQALLGSVTPETPEPRRRLIQAGVRYFLMADDADDDLASASRFDDDVRVMNVVTTALGRADLEIVGSA